MNLRLKSGTSLSVLAVIVSTGLALAWLFDLGIGMAAWVTRLGLLMVSIALATIASVLLIRRIQSSGKTIRRYIDALCQLEPHDLCGDKVLRNPVRRDNPWDRTFNQLQNRLVEYGERLQIAEQARARAEIRCQRLSAERQQMSEVLENLSDPVVAIDTFDELILVNGSAERLFDFDRTSTESRVLNQLIQCESLIEMLTQVRRRKGKAQRTNDLKLECPDGKSKWYNATAYNFVARDGIGSDAQENNAVAVLRDISGQKAMQKRHAEFVSAVSHEMKTPLSGIKAYVELLADGEVEDEDTKEEFLGIINSQADRLQRLIENLLNIARIEAGAVEVKKQPQSLNEILEESLRIVQPAADQKHIDLCNDLSQMYLGVLADRDMLLQASINLLSNAIKYTPGGGKVTIRSRMQVEEALFEVEDSGVGLEEEDQQRVFEKFYRVDRDKNMAVGTGLGLSLAKHIAEDVHGGKLTVESVAGKGSTFRIAMPLAAQLV